MLAQLMCTIFKIELQWGQLNGCIGNGTACKITDEGLFSCPFMAPNPVLTFGQRPKLNLKLKFRSPADNPKKCP